MVAFLRCLGLGLLLCCLAGVSVSVAQSRCTKTKTNPLGSGTPRQPITVSSTAVAVAPVNTSRCTLLIVNLATDADMACADVTNDATPTATTGILVRAGATLELQTEGQGRWQCIRSGATDATAAVAEALP